MSYFQVVLYDTLNHLRQRKLSNTIREDHPFKDLCDFLGENSVEELRQRIDEGNLPESIIKQYDRVCDIIWDGIR